MQGAEDTCTVLVNCKEKGRVRLHAGTYVSGVEGELSQSNIPTD
jgi:hypothetical protein